LAASFSSSEEFERQAYRRSDALEKRRKLMEAWAAYCEHGLQLMLFTSTSPSEQHVYLGVKPKCWRPFRMWVCPEG